MRRPLEMDSGESSHALALLEERLGFVPNLYKAQQLLPSVLQGETKLLDAVLFQTRSLSRVQKECILLVLSAMRGCAACAAIHYQSLRLLSVPEQRLNLIVADYRKAKLSKANEALVSIALRVGLVGNPITNKDLSLLAAHGLNEESALEAILTAALGNFLCAVSEGLCVEPDFEPPSLPESFSPEPYWDEGSESGRAASMQSPTLSLEFPPFVILREQLGCLPRIFPAQSRRPDVIEAEAEVVSAILSSNGFLNRTEKEDILRANDLGFIAHGFAGGHLVEAVVTTGLACFLETLQAGLGLADLPLGNLKNKLQSFTRPFPSDD